MFFSIKKAKVRKKEVRRKIKAKRKYFAIKWRFQR